MNGHNLLLARHAAMDMSAIGWGIDCIQFKQPHKPGVAGLHCERFQYHKQNFTMMDMSRAKLIQ